MTTGLVLASILFSVSAVVSEKNALWLPAILLLVAAAANAVLA